MSNPTSNTQEPIYQVLRRAAHKYNLGFTVSVTFDDRADANKFMEFVCEAPLGPPTLQARVLEIKANLSTTEIADLIDRLEMLRS